jgi:1-aminocyclopropane-1-carboxylate deaminase
MQINLSAITVEKIALPLFAKKNIEVSVLRLDKIHPEISGNKWFKLRFYLETAKREEKTHLVTFGGAWSNHVLATAAAAKLNGFSSTAIIRGEENRQNEMLSQAAGLGMKFIFIGRKDYSNKIIPEGTLDEKSLLIPEGGAGEPGIAGAATILDHCDKSAFTDFICASGTGTMAEGLNRSISKSQKLIAIPVIKGYGKFTPSLLQFMNEFYKMTHIPTDFVYTGKMFYRAMEMIAADHFPSSSRLLFIHSGGLQGNRSLTKGTLIF